MTNEMIQTKYVELLNKHFRESWMNDNDFDTFVNYCILHSGGWERLCSEINVGVSNGHSVEYQLNVVDEMWKSNKSLL